MHKNKDRERLSGHGKHIKELAPAKMVTLIKEERAIRISRIIIKII